MYSFLSSINKWTGTTEQYYVNDTTSYAYYEILEQRPPRRKGNRIFQYTKSKKIKKTTLKQSRRMTIEPKKNDLSKVMKNIRDKLEVKYDKPLDKNLIKHISAKIAVMRHGANVFHHHNTYFVMNIEGNVEDRISNLKEYKPWNITEESIDLINIIRSSVLEANNTILYYTSKNSKNCEVLVCYMKSSTICEPPKFRYPPPDN